MPVAVVSVPVSDQDASIAFYTDIVGLKLVADAPMGPEMRWVQLQPVTGGATIALVTWFSEMKPGGMQGLLLHVADIQAEFDRLSAMGVEVTPLEEQPWGRFTMLKDPDGNGLILCQLSQPDEIVSKL